MDKIGKVLITTTIVLAVLASGCTIWDFVAYSFGQSIKSVNKSTSKPVQEGVK